MLQPKRNNKKISPAKKYNTSKSKTGDSLAEDVFEIFDPTGISSYDDVYRSYKDNGLLSWQTGLEVLGALPIIGKVGKGIKAGRTANKYIKALTKVNKTVAKSEKVVPKVLKFGKEFGTTAQKVSRGGRANPVAAASIGVGMGADGFQKLTKIIEKTTGKGVKKIISKAPAKKAAIKTTGATVNTVNTLSDVAGAVQGQVVEPIVEKVKPTAKQQGKPKVVYYNTNPKRGEVEKPGDEEGVQYVPVSNSVQLEKWKAQNNVPVTSDLKTKVAREVLGAVLPDQAAQFLSAIATKDNKLGLQDLTPDIQEALIKSVKNAQKRTGKDSGGTEYIDYSPEVEQAFQGMSAGKKQMVSTDPAIQAATMLGRVSYKKNALGETEIYDSYDFSKTNPEKADTFYKKVRAYAGTALPDDGKKPNLIGKIPVEELAFGTNSQGIMKNKMNPRKKYANGSDAKGMNTNNYIISPAEALADYDIMMAKAENAAINNPWAPYVSAIGGAASSFLSNSAGLLTADGAAIKGNAGGILKKAIAKGGNIIASNSGGATAAMGMNNVQADVEVEGGERYKTPQGQTGEFQGASHEENGIPLQVTQNPNANPEQGEAPEGTIVYSDRLKIGDKTLAERQASRERQTANLEKIASQPLVDQAVKNASKRKMMAIQKEEMADLDFQDKVNNIQQMADTVVAAFGTGMAGLQDNPIGDSMEYGYGTGMTGVQKYPLGTPPGGIKLPKAPTADMDTNVIRNFQTLLGMDPKTPGFGEVWGPKSKALYEKVGGDVNVPTQEDLLKDPWGWALDSFSDKGLTKEGYLYKDPEVPDLTGLTNNAKVWDINSSANAPAKVNPMDAITEAQPEETSNLDVQAALNGTGMFAKGADTDSGEPSKFKQALVNSIPSLGDATKLFGNMLGMNAGIKTATEQRASDVPFQNVFRNAGEESQRMLDNAKQGIETNKAQAIVKANANTRTGMKGGRGARSFNAKQGMDWLYNTALNQQIADITANAAQQMSGIDIQKSGVAMSADQLKGQGEWQRATAEAAAKDAYFTALALGRKDQATGMQQTGKDLNSMKENKIIEGLMKQYGTYFTGSESGVAAKSYEELTGKKGKEEIFLGPDGKTKFKLGPNNKLIEVTV